MSNYHGCKWETINLIPHYLIQIIYKAVKLSHSEKLKIIQNINKLILQVIFIFSDWILIKQIIVSSTPLFLVLRGNRFSKNCTWIFDWGTGARVKMHRFNSFSNVNTVNRKNFPTHGGIYKSEKIEQSFWREIKP